jgi:hypothetical protein
MNQVARIPRIAVTTAVLTTVGATASATGAIGADSTAALLRDVIPNTLCHLRLHRP